jgi:multiple sugar transport system substrate-binding protein
MIRRLTTVLAAALLAVAAAQTTITFWPSSNPEEIAFATQVVADWNAANPDIQVRMQPLPASRSTEEVLLAAIAARTTPDVAANIYPGAISQFVDAGGLYEHDTLEDFLPFMTERSGADVLRLYTHPSGHVYQIPWKANPVMFAYNVTLLAEAGIEPEQLATYSGFLAAARTVHEHWGGTKHLYAPTVDVTWWQRFFDFYTLYIAASGGRTLLDDEGRVIFDGEAGQEVFEFLSTLFREGLAPKGQTAQNRFFGGTALVEQAGPFTMPFYERNAPEGFAFALIPPPVPDHGRARTSTPTATRRTSPSSATRGTPTRRGSSSGSSSPRRTTPASCASPGRSPTAWGWRRTRSSPTSCRIGPTCSRSCARTPSPAAWTTPRT